MPKHFTDEEVAGLDPNLVLLLDAAREIAGVPFAISEGLASGGSHVQNSAHKRGKAVDLSAPNANARFKIVSAALQVGFNRIGVYNLHVHLDNDESLPQDVMWVGVSK